MRMSGIVVVSAMVCASAQAAAFENLTFDQPRTNAFVPGPVGEQAPMADAIPGWTLKIRSDTLNGVYSGTVNASAVGHAMEPVFLLYPQGNFFSESQGFSLYFTLPLGTQVPRPGMSFYQVGDVPAWAGQLSFLSYGSLNLRINGQALPRTGGSVPYENVVDISPWAGQTVRLEFSASESIGDLDIIGFSPVPEPGVWTLLLLAVPCLVWRRFATGGGGLA
jgi:hypothetical protein